MDRDHSGVSRRDLFSIAGALGIGALGIGAFARVARADGDKPAATEAASLQGAGFYKLKLGATEVSVISDGGFLFDPVFPLFGENAGKEAVEKALAEAFISPSHVAAHINGLLVRTPKETVLIDTGCGNGMGPTAGKLMAHLARANVKPADVGAVILTHAHGDHYGGLMTEDGKPAFPNAELFIHKTEHAFWSGDNPDLSKSGLSKEWQTNMIGGAKKVLGALKFTQVEGEKEIRPGISVVHAFGHTPGHIGLLIDGGANNQLLHITDAIHHFAIQMPHPDYFVAFDADRDQAVATRKKILDRAAADKVLVSGAHLPFPAVGHVRKSGEVYAWVPAVWEW
jgi:glyoxylase-like metal-dependent hydrolase (beta-lactamase superfamily II)